MGHHHYIPSNLHENFAVTQLTKDFLAVMEFSHTMTLKTEIIPPIIALVMSLK
jgi:hypothetical protein